jgi:hypothetical protein
MRNKTTHSIEWSLSAELIKKCRRTYIALVIVLVLWVATLVGFAFLVHYDHVDTVRSQNEATIPEGRMGRVYRAL